MDTLFDKIVATIQTRWKQYRCRHGPWTIDWHMTNGKRTCHCSKCWKRAYEGTFAYKMARKETFEEWIHRAVGNGMSLQQAQDVWVEFKLFDEPALDGEQIPLADEDWKDS